MCAADTLGMLPSLGLQEPNLFPVLLVVLPATLSATDHELPQGLEGGRGVEPLAHGSAHVPAVSFSLQETSFGYQS